MCEKVVSKERLMLKYCLDIYKPHKMCKETIDACLASLKFVPDLFVTNKMFKDLDNAVFLMVVWSLLIRDSLC